MKKIILLIFNIFLFWSCSQKEPEHIYKEDNAVSPVITSQFETSYPAFDQDKAEEGEIWEEMTWNEASYGVAFAIQYDIEIALDASFTNSLVIGTTPNTNYEILTFTINEALKSLGVTEGQSTEVNFRVVANAQGDGSAVGQEYPSLISSNTDVTDLSRYEKVYQSAYILSDINDYDLEKAKANKDFVASSLENNIYDGYLPLSTNGFAVHSEIGDFMFDDFEAVNGGTRGEDGTIVPSDGEGYYNIALNLFDEENKTITLVKTEWAIIGNATSAEWNLPGIPMEYNAETRVWEVTSTLISDGELKFIANADWNFTFGVTDGEFVFGGEGIKTIPENGNYKITLDLSNSPNYLFILDKID